MVVLLIISIVLQFLAAVYALRLIRVTGAWTSWIVVAAAVGLMAVRRSIVLSHVIEDPTAFGLDWISEVVGLGVSGLMLAGIASMEPMFRTMRRTERELAKERNFAATVLDTAAALVVVLDRQGTIHRFNGACERTTGYTEDEVFGRPIWDFLLLDDERERVKRRIAHMFSGHFPNSGVNHWRTKSGGKRLIEWTNTALRDEEGRVAFVIGTGIDVTERQQFQIALNASEDRYRTLMDNANDAIIVADAETGVIISANRTTETLLGRPIEDIVGRTQDVLHPPADAERYRRIFQSHTRKGSAREDDAVVIGAEGRLIPVSISATVTEFDGRRVVLGIFRDMTERKRIEVELRESERRFRHMSYHDELTGLRNRSFFDKEMALLDADLESVKPISVISIDIDGMKTANDTFGHRFGDEILAEAAKLVSIPFSESDIVSRVGGDEFAVILPGVEWAEAMRKAQEIRGLINAHNAAHTDHPISMSLGVAGSFPERRESLYEIYQRADDRMYSYKLTQSTSPKSRLVDILMSALAERDRDTSSHIERLVVMVSMMADRMKIDEQKKRNLILLARMHDVGKVGVPDEILFKPGKLTAEELPRMREHVLIGYNIALRSKELRHIADLVLHHHESWNGDGYPKKLKGEEIPLECRVLSVVDAYDAMTHHRPYHEGISQEAAFEELRNKSGIQFDPEVVGIFIQLMNEVPILANVRNAPESAHEAGITSRRTVAIGGNGARHDKLN